MRQSAAHEKLFLPKPQRCGERFDDQTVEFIYEADGNLLLLAGRFATQLNAGRECVYIQYTGRLAPGDPPVSSYVFELSSTHVRSVVPATKPGARLKFLMEKPLGPQDRVKDSARVISAAVASS